ncbi:unnamed protein product, partial [Meganyctiphanes norvegica]
MFTELITRCKGNKVIIYDLVMKKMSNKIMCEKCPTFILSIHVFFQLVIHFFSLLQLRLLVIYNLCIITCVCYFKLSSCFQFNIFQHIGRTENIINHMIKDIFLQGVADV